MGSAARAHRRAAIRNPDAVTAFFDLGGNGTDPNHVRNDHLKYLAGSGDDSRTWPRHAITGVVVTTMDDPTSRMGLGAALEAAATGHVPLGAGQDPWPEAEHRFEGYFVDEDGRGHLSTTSKDLIQVMRELSDDPNAYATLHKAEAGRRGRHTPHPASRRKGPTHR